MAAPADALMLNPRGTGQVLIYPYYTVNAGYGTLLSIVNTTLHGKALKVRFHEGHDGRVVFAFNLYLSPYDVWVAQTFDTSADGSGGAAIATRDNSCTVPAFAPAPGAGANAGTVQLLSRVAIAAPPEPSALVSNVCATQTSYGDK